MNKLFLFVSFITFAIIPNVSAADTSESQDIKTLEATLQSDGEHTQVPSESEDSLLNKIEELKAEEAELEHRVYLLRVKIAATQQKIDDQKVINKENRERARKSKEQEKKLQEQAKNSDATKKN